MDGATFADYTAHHPECYCNHLFFVDEGEGRLSARCMMENLVEDPATGSANGDLAAYLLQHDYFGERDAAYTVCQGEDMGRRSILRVHVARKANEWLIGIGGRCSTVASGEWR
jgi:trans-2,3-dihydro-3-hydroxyanthranilate isomerase